MEFYVVLFIITSIAGCLSLTSISGHSKRLVFLLVIFIFMFLSAIRWNNPDWDVYYPFFMQNDTFDEFTNGLLDPGYGVVNWLIKSAGGDFSSLLTALAVIIIGIFANFMQSFSPYPLLSLLYWFGTYIGEIFFNRQALAIAITLISFRFIVSKKLLLFIATTILAATMQASVIVFLLAYPIYHLRIRPLYLIVFLFLCIVIGSLLDSSLFILVAEMINFIDVNQARLMQKVALYYDVGVSSQDIAAMLVSSIRRLIMIPFEVYFINQIEKLNPYYRGCVNLTVFGYGLFFLFRNALPIVAARSSTPFYIYEIILLPMFFLMAHSLTTRIVLFSLLLTYSLIKYIYGISMYEEYYIPYVNILFK